MDSLSEFLVKETPKTDIFCLTEVNPEILEELKKIFLGYKTYYSEIVNTDYLDGKMEGQAIFVKESLPARGYKKHLIYEVNKQDAGAFETIKVSVGTQDLLLGSVHGMAKPGTKNDTPERLKQSRNILNIIGDFEGPVVFGGDFNLNPDTKSIEIFEDAGFKNLIKKYDVKDTRGSINRELYQDSDEGVQYFADYVFTNDKVKATNFSVPQIKASDHLPLILEFEI